MKKICLSLIWYFTLQGMSSSLLTLKATHDILRRDGQETAVKIFTREGIKTLFPGQTCTFKIECAEFFYIEFSWLFDSVHHLETWYIQTINPKNESDKKEYYEFNLNILLRKSDRIIGHRRLEQKEYVNEPLEIENLHDSFLEPLEPFARAVFTRNEKSIKTSSLPSSDYVLQEKDKNVIEDPLIDGELVKNFALDLSIEKQLQIIFSDQSY